MDIRGHRLMALALLAAFFAGGAMGGMKSEPSPNAHSSRESGIRELLDFIRERNGRGWQDGSGPRGPVGDLLSVPPSTAEIWLATNAKTVALATNTQWARYEIPQTLAYFGGFPHQHIHEWAAALDGWKDHDRRGGQGFGKRGPLAAVPEPAPIFLVGTILLATFSIARLRFKR